MIKITEKEFNALIDNIVDYIDFATDNLIHSIAPDVTKNEVSLWFDLHPQLPVSLKNLKTSMIKLQTAREREIHKCLPKYFVKHKKRRRTT